MSTNLRKIRKLKADISKLQEKTRFSKSSKKSQIFNLSESVIPQSLSNLPRAGVGSERVLTCGEDSLRSYVSESYAKCLRTLDRIWAEGVRLLQKTRAQCYERKPELADFLDTEFQEVGSLEQFKIGRTASKDNFEEVRKSRPFGRS